MIHTDQRSLILSTNSDGAAHDYRSGVDLLLSLWPGADEALKRSIQQDPDFALAYAALARLHAIHAQASQAKADISRAEMLVVNRGTKRERSHVAVLSLAINGRPGEALAASMRHLEEWPEDVLIFGLPLGAFGLLAFSGMANHDQARVDLCERHARRYSSDDWWFLTYRGWAHAENGNLGLGRKLTHRSLEIRRSNGNGAHALAHVLHESGASDEAQHLIADWLPSYDRSGVLHGHLAWHGALIALEQGDVARALDYYVGNVAPRVSKGTPVNIVSDSASFLWRLQVYGHQAPRELWAEAANFASGFFQQPGFAFADFHIALIEVGACHKESFDRRLRDLAQALEGMESPVGYVTLRLCEAIRAFAEERFYDCGRILAPLASDVARIGGSGAQREIVDDMLVVSWMKAGEVIKARAALDRRLKKRPSIRDSGWLKSLISAE